MSENRLAEIQARCEAATPGHWTSNVDGLGECLMPVIPETVLRNPTREESKRAWDDADFIAHAREDVPWLLDEVRRLTEEWAATRRQLRIESDVQYELRAGHEAALRALKRCGADVQMLRADNEALRKEMARDG